MLYAAWSKYPIKGKIMSAISHDGIKWFKKKKAVIEPSVIYDIKHCSEPAIIRFHGKFCVFYEGSDKHGRWRILKSKLKDLMIGIIDYGSSNIASITNALDYLEVDYKLIDNGNEMMKYSKFILPGVGSFDSWKT